ncbi:YbaB/EbfC family nucleoid-associated protein [Dactylosporangium sp. NPDC005572]|uniref:YbaB/EbfC family nucleoid-associated protein n=1 Tax=Dactylosporangium sp. NPDC005572 TaxID=3156889 RepID=UPI00339FA759
MARIDIDDMMSQFGRMIEGATEGIRRLATEEFVGSAAEGRVRAVVTGGRNLVAIDFAPRSTREIDNFTLGEAVVEAVNAAEDQAEERRQALMREFQPAGFDMDRFMRDPTSLVPKVPATFGTEPQQ